MDSLEGVGTTVTVGSVAELANILANMTPEQLDNVQLDPILYNALVQTIESNPDILDTNNQTVDEGNQELNMEALSSNVKLLNSDAQVSVSDSQLLDSNSKVVSSTSISDSSGQVCDTGVLSIDPHIPSSSIQLLDPNAQILLNALEEHSHNHLQQPVSIMQTSNNVHNSHELEDGNMSNCQTNPIISDSQLSSSIPSPSPISCKDHESLQLDVNQSQKAFSSQINEVNEISAGESQVSTLNQTQHGIHHGEEHKLQNLESHDIIKSQSLPIVATSTVMSQVTSDVKNKSEKSDSCHQSSPVVSPTMQGNNPKNASENDDSKNLHTPIKSDLESPFKKKDDDMIQRESSENPTNQQIDNLDKRDVPALENSSLVHQPAGRNYSISSSGNLEGKKHISGSSLSEQSNIPSKNSSTDGVLYAIPIITSRSKDSKDLQSNLETTDELSSRILLTPHQLSDLLAGNNGNQSFEGIITNKGGESILHLNSNTNVSTHSNIQIINLESPKIKHNKIIAPKEKKGKEHPQSMSSKVKPAVSVHGSSPHKMKKLKKNDVLVGKKPQFIKAPSHSELVEIRNNVIKSATPVSSSNFDPSLSQCTPSSTMQQASQITPSKINNRSPSSVSPQKKKMNALHENYLTTNGQIQNRGSMHQADRVRKLSDSKEEKVIRKRLTDSKFPNEKSGSKDTISPIKSSTYSHLDNDQTYNKTQLEGSLSSVKLEKKYQSSSGENLKKIPRTSSAGGENELQKSAGTDSPSKKKTDFTVHGKFPFNRSFRKGSLDYVHSKKSVENSFGEGSNKHTKEVNEILHMREAIKSSRVGDGEMAMRQMAKLEIENQLKRFGQKVNLVKSSKEQRLLRSPGKKVDQPSTPHKRKKQGTDGSLYENSQHKINHMLKSEAVKQDDLIKKDCKDGFYRKSETNKEFQDSKEQVRKRERPKKFDDFVLGSKQLKKEKKLKTRKFFFPEDFESKLSQKSINEDYSQDEEVYDAKSNTCNASSKNSTISQSECKVLITDIEGKDRLKSDIIVNQKDFQEIKENKVSPMPQAKVKVSIENNEVVSSTSSSDGISTTSKIDSDSNIISHNLKDTKPNVDLDLHGNECLPVGKDFDKNIVGKNLENRSFLDAISTDTGLSGKKVKEVISNMLHDTKDRKLVESNDISGIVTSVCDAPGMKEEFLEINNDLASMTVNKDKSLVDINIRSETSEGDVSETGNILMSTPNEKTIDHVPEPGFESKNNSIPVDDTSSTIKKVMKRKKKKKTTIIYEPEVLPAHLKYKSKSVKVDETIIDLSKVKQKNPFSETTFILDDVVQLETHDLLRKDSWVCNLCGRPGNVGDLDVLFGPYKIQIKSDNYKTDNMFTVWVHRDCAIWTPTICLSNQVLCGLGDALNSAAKLKCTLCLSIGATLQCSFRQCRDGYHYICATQKGCSFNRENFTITCPKHT